MDSLDYLVEFCSEDTCMKISWMKLNLYNPVCYLEESFGDVLWYMEIFPLVNRAKYIDKSLSQGKYFPIFPLLCV